MTRYEELRACAIDLQERMEKLPWTKVAEEHARLEIEIKKAYTNHEISGAQAGRLMKALP